MGAVLGVVLAVGIAGGAFLVLGDGDDDAEAGDGGATGGPTTGTSPEAEADALPQSYVGEWEGDVTIDPGVAGGTMVIVLEPGRVGQEIGTATGTDVAGLFTCVDLLTLSEVTADRIVFDAKPDPERTNGWACAQGEFRYTLEPRGENAIHFSTDSPEGRNRGVLDRQTQ